MLTLAAAPVLAVHRDTLGIGARTYFVENRGQWDAPFRFKAQMHNAALFCAPDCLTIALSASPDDKEISSGHHAMSSRMHCYKVHFLNANPNTLISGEHIDTDGGYDNYYLGSDPARWATRLPHCMSLFYSQLYPGVDMDIRVASNALKSNLYVAPGANPASIVMQYEGADRLYLSNGNLVIRTSVGEIVELAPYAYQESDTGRTEVSVRYQIRANEVRFAVADYDRTRPLVIDPTLHFSTYTGSTADNWGTTATFDQQKNTYTAGLVFGTGYPVSAGAYDGTHNRIADVGIFKFDTTGSQRIYATYLGGSHADMPHSMFVNSFNELVIFGTTGSRNFPVTPDAYDTSFNNGTRLQFENSSEIDFPNGSDIFVSRFSEDGCQLQASTFVGGSNNDGLNFRTDYNDYTILMQGNGALYYNYGDGARGELITDDLNNVYVGSTTFSIDFPTTEHSVQPRPWNKQNGIVFKLDYNLRTLIWSTYLGGSEDDAVYSIDVDSAYNVVVCGGTASSDFPTTPGAWQTSYGGGSADGFVAKISYNGDRLISSTYYGSSAYDQCYFVRCGKHNEVFIYGQTQASGSTMVYNANYNVPGSGMLLARLYPDLSGREWSTVFGTPLGRPNLSPTAFAADLCNRVYAAGWGRDFANYNGVSFGDNGTTGVGSDGMETTPDAYSSTTDGQDFYIMSISADASVLDYATFFGELHTDNNGAHRYWGADHVDGGTSRFDKHATLYQSVCGGCAGSSRFPTSQQAWADSNGSSNCNNAVFRFNVHDDFAVAEFVAPPVGCEPYTVQFQNIGRGDSFWWDFGDGTTSADAQPQHTFSQPGTYTVRLIATKSYGCRVHDTCEAEVVVLNNGGNHMQTRASCTGDPFQIGSRPRLGCTYEWIQGAVSDSSVANPYVFNSGTYILRITSAQGCTEVDTFEVTYLTLLDSLLIIPPTCPGGSDGRAIAFTRSNASDSARYFWDGAEGDSLLTGLSADGRAHTLSIQSHGCTFDTTFVVNDPPRLDISKESQAVLCSDSCDAWVHLSYGYPGTLVGDTLLENLCAGEHILCFADPAGCPYADTTLVVRDYALEHMRAWADDTLFFLNESTLLHATPVPGAVYSWDNAHTLSNPHSSDPVATPDDTITTYTVTVIDSLGCRWEGSVTLYCTEVICGKPNIFIPNAFSPNGDGINDRLCCRGNFVLDFHLVIFTRWGEKVFETHDIHDCWDGRHNGNWCQPGVYTYSCKVKCEAGEENLLKGDITLIK